MIDQNKDKNIFGQWESKELSVQNKYRLKILEQTQNKVSFKLTENSIEVDPEISIEVPNDKVIDEVMLGRCTEQDVPYQGASVGDFYLITTIENSSKIIYTSLADLSQLSLQVPIIEGYGIKLEEEIIDNKEYQKISIDPDILDVTSWLGYVPENIENKININTDQIQEESYPTAKSVKEMVDNTVGNIKIALSKI